MAQDYGNWHWQQLGTAWKGIGIYHVTLTVPSRDPLFGKLVIPDNDPKQARVERTEMGKQIIGVLARIPEFHPEIRLLQYCLMPDHLHAILYVTQQMPKGIMTAVRGFWQGARKIGRAYSAARDVVISSVTPNNIRENERNCDSELHCGSGSGEGLPFPIFTKMPFIRPLSRKGQLQTMIRYVQMNPQRLATKRLMPKYFRVQEGIQIAGRTYAAVGNAELLQRVRYMPVHVRRTMVEEAEHGDNRRLRDYMNSCVLAARQGAVMVSPFIMPKEKEVMEVLLKEGLPFIYIADNGFRDYYKPQDSLFDAVAGKQVLILSPWDYDPHKQHVSRAECVEMNQMAEQICTLSIDPEFNSGLTIH